MKRRLTIIFIWTLLQSCTESGPIDINSIQIVRTNQHPIFVDHERKLVTVDKNGKTIDELDLYPDTGDGCDSYLFDSGSKFVLVDCNGHWFGIEKKTGELKSEGWKWNEKLPDIHLGKFIQSDGEVNYLFSSVTDFELTEVYRHKDPR